MVATISLAPERSTSIPDAADKTNDADRTTTPRKRPCCKKCGKPMLGHKRGQCDMDSTATKVKEEDADESKAAELVTDLAALHIDKNGCNEHEAGKMKSRFASAGRHSSPAMPWQLVKQDTLASLTSNEKAVLETLGTPGIMAKDDVVNESAARAGVERWLDSIPRSASPKRSSQKHLTGPPIVPSRDLDAVFDIPPPRKNNEISKKRSIAKTAKPLVRASNAAERGHFFEELAQKSKKPVAGVFTVDMKDIQALEETAKHLNLHAHVIAPKYADGSTGMGWLVVGRDEESVREVFSEVEREVKSTRASSGGCMSTLGSLLTGAVVAWTLLAFS